MGRAISHAVIKVVSGVKEAGKKVSEAVRRAVRGLSRITGARPGTVGWILAALLSSAALGSGLYAWFRRYR